MKRFLIHILSFAILFFIGEKLSYFFLIQAPKREYDKRLEKIIKGEINKDLVVLGSSRGAGNVLAGQIEKETGLTAYNLSYQGSNVIFHQFILKTLLDYNSKPKTILLVVDNPYEFVEEESLGFRYDKLYPLTKYSYINNILIKNGEHSSISKFLFLERLHSCHSKLKKEKAPDENPIDASGSMPLLISNKKLPDYLMVEENYKTDCELEDRLNAFRNIQNICREKNIELVFVVSPNYKTLNIDFIARFKKLMLPENKIKVYDTENSIYKDSSYFYDVSHLNKKGAEIFTKELIQFINSK